MQAYHLVTITGTIIPVPCHPVWEFHLHLWFLKQFSEMWLLNVAAAICVYKVDNESDSHLSQSLAKMTSANVNQHVFCWVLTRTLINFAQSWITRYCIKCSKFVHSKHDLSFFSGIYIFSNPSFPSPFCLPLCLRTTNMDVSQCTEC